MEMTMIVRIKEDDPRFGLTAGELYRAERYWLDPHIKYTLLSRIPDGWDPECNAYTHQVERVPESEASDA